MRLLVAAVVALLIVVAGCDGDDGDSPAQDGQPAQGGQPAQSGTGGAIPDLVEQVSPSVVAVRARTARGVGEGSGVIWDENTIVTNAHVAEGAEEIEIALASGERLAATVEAADTRTDLAILSPERGGLPAATFADELPRVGELAVAIGNPLGFEDTVTAGIVSGLDRALPTGGQTPALVALIQTDAAISPGNSGGALVGRDGEVIGVNVAYVPPQTPAVSIGFAIPAPQVRHVVTELLDDGEVEHAFVGVELAPLTPSVREGLGIEVEGGVAILGVEPGSPAAEADVAPGDAIVAAGGERVTQVEDVYAAVRDRVPGDELELELVRDGERRTVTVTLAERE